MSLSRRKVKITFEYYLFFKERKKSSNMKNNLILIISFLAFNASLIAQEFNKQYSVKTTSWIENKLNLSSSPYQITIKTLGEASNKRFSAGVDFRTAYSASLASSLNLSLSFGKERFKDFGKSDKWRLFYGLDYLAGVRASVHGSSWAAGVLSLGIAPFAGLQYRINERLVVYTETNYALTVSGTGSNRRAFQALLNNRFTPVGSIWLGFELFKAK